MGIAMPSPELDRKKRDKLKDVLRRMMANPQTLDEVVGEISMDWFPMCLIDGAGNVDFVLGSGKKK